MSAFEERRPNADQQAVINDLEHNIILYASAGTGKTFTVARRVHHIIETGRAKPEEILCLTFTIKAAGEMKNDILQYAGADGSKSSVSTIHSFAYQVLKEESISRPEFYCLPCVCDETDSAQELKDCLLALGLPSSASILRNENALTQFLSVMKHQRELCQRFSGDEENDFQSLYRHIQINERALFEKMTVFYDPAARRENTDVNFLKLMDSKAGTFLHMYNDQLRKSNLLDFDDLICQTHQLFRSTDAGERWRSRFRYIIIDEMQDTTELEYDTLQHLFSGNNVMMCGDYFQTIYEWRGSNPEKILARFTEQCHAVPFMFSRNYRSTKTLTSASVGYLQNM
ncbi:MAG: UvrD-helicase domain-containing protein, partial [Clostridia bacterium]|nr:UvrD-helicase domain-containing protein [Clostridia bacterium]